MSSAEYTALPSDAAGHQSLSLYPPDTRAPPQLAPTAANKRSFDWPETPTILKRSIIVLLVLLSGFLFLKLEHGSIGAIYGSPEPPAQDNSKPNTPITADPDMYGGRPRSGKLNIAYFVNWGIYGRKYPPSLIPAEELTHILYAFANVRSSGEVFLSDDWADKDIHYEGDSWNDQGKNLYGNFKQIYLLKKKHRHLKLMLSIGGWTYSPNFHPVVVDPSARKEFVRSSIKLLEDFGLDGLDIDYEYPSNDAQASGYTELLRLLREGLDEHAQKKGNGCRFELSIAAPCGPDHYQKLHAKEMDRYLDMWNLMAYDYSGSWDKIANHQANVYNGPISGSKATEWYTRQGIAPNKLVIGLPLYGRSFLNTKGPGHSFSGVGPGSWEAGSYDFRALPLPGSTVHHDSDALASYSYDPAKKEFITFDDAIVAKWKAEWIIKEDFGGAMYWELSGDKSGWSEEKGRQGMEGGAGKEYVPGQSLVTVVKKAFGKLDQSQNWLEYGESQFDNMRKCME
ncbi:Endochitinase 1 [Tulasnella sp. 424]|nr:Endochitinase 1 [Tulasnella sp. 424]KAG8977235.1 Endochitinase 1 [Tulasnella sp. 425]